MNEQDSVRLFAEELLAVVGVLRRHLETLRHPDRDGSHAAAQAEFHRLAEAATDLSTGFHADDCARVAQALVRASTLPQSPDGDAPLLAPHVSQALKYLFDRAADIHKSRRVTFPTDPQLATLPGLLAAFQLAVGATPPDGSLAGWAFRAPSDSGIGPAVLRPHRDPATRTIPLRDLQADAAHPPPPLDLPPPSTLAPAEHTPETLAELAGLATSADAEPLAHTEEAAQGAPQHPAVTPPLEADDARGDVLWGTRSDAALEPEAALEETPVAAGPGPKLTEDEWKIVRTFQSSTLLTSEAPPSPPDERAAVGPLAPAVQGPALPTPVPEAQALDLDAIPPEMVEFFRREAAEDLQALRDGLLRLERQDDPREPLADLARTAHKLKGSAAQFDFAALAAVTMALEDVLKLLQARRVAPSPEMLSGLTAFVALAQAAADLADPRDPAGEALIRRSAELRDELRATLPSAADVGSRAASATAPGTPTMTMSATTSAVALATTENLLGLDPPTPPMDAPLKLDVRELDDLTAQVHGLAFSRASLSAAHAEAVARLGDLQAVALRLREVYARLLDEMASDAPSGGERRRAAGGRLARMFGGHQAAADEPGRGLALERYDELDQALRALGEVVADTDAATLELRGSLARLGDASNAHWMASEAIQRDVLRLRLVPLADLLPLLQFEVRRLGHGTGRRVAFSVIGEDTRIDRHVLDALRDPLIQLVRNAILHGIEDADEREATGKPPEGHVWLHARHEGTDVVIELGDDGRGANPARLVASARMLGRVPASATRELREDEALQLMFEPGVTTLDKAGLVGGRGIGLDQVRTEIRRLRGSITVSSRSGQGSVFRIRAPISLSMLHALYVTASGLTYAIPFDAVERTVMPEGLAADPDAAAAAQANGARRTVVIPATEVATTSGPLNESAAGVGLRVPALALADLLGVPGSLASHPYALVVADGPRRAAVLVDDIGEDRDVVVQALPRHLRRRILRGATVTPTGEIALVVDVAQLVAGALGGTPIRPTMPPAAHAAVSELASAVLVVDDSEAVRRSIEHMLVRAGYAVETASDGIEALEKMLTHRPLAVLLDVEMPGLDGFELLATMRGHERLVSVPVAMLTSRAGDRHVARARELGAAAYLVKPCPRDTLLETMRTLVPQPVGIHP